MANTATEFSFPAWRKSSYSNGDGGECLEVADNLPHVVPVRDSKTAPHGPVLNLRADTWAHFVAAIQCGSFPA